MDTWYRESFHPYLEDYKARKQAERKEKLEDLIVVGIMAITSIMLMLCLAVM